MEDATTRPVGDPAGEGDETPAEGFGDDGSVDVESEGGDPTDQVMGEGSEEKPGGVGCEHPGGAVVGTGAFFPVSDGKLAGGVAAMVDVQ